MYGLCVPYHLIEVCLIGLLLVVILDSAPCAGLRATTSLKVIVLSYFTLSD